MKWFAIEGLQQFLVQIVWVRLKVLELVALIRRRRPAWSMLRLENGPLVCHEVVIIIFHFGDVGVKSLLSPFQPFASYFCLKLFRWILEVIKRISGSFKSKLMEFSLDALVVGAGE